MNPDKNPKITAIRGVEPALNNAPTELNLPVMLFGTAFKTMDVIFMLINAIINPIKNVKTKSIIGILFIAINMNINPVIKIYIPIILRLSFVFLTFLFTASMPPKIMPAGNPAINSV